MVLQPHVEFVKRWQTVHADAISKTKRELAINLGTLDWCFSHTMFCLLTDLFTAVNAASSFSYSEYKVLVQFQNTISTVLYLE